jgi:hypothetical protein
MVEAWGEDDVGSWNGTFSDASAEDISFDAAASVVGI